MEELSIEEKAKAYDEVIQKLRGMMPNWERLSYNGKTFLQDLIYIIPELKESEDERIIKAIKSAVLQLTDIYLQEKYGLKQSDCIAWLEKQGQVKESAISQHENRTCEENGNSLTSEDAIEREVKEDAGGYPYIDATELYDYENDKPLAKAGDKVKVLIIKE